MAKYTIELRKICDIYGREEVEKWFKDYDIKNLEERGKISCPKCGAKLKK